MYLCTVLFYKQKYSRQPIDISNIATANRKNCAGYTAQSKLESLSKRIINKWSKKSKNYSRAEAVYQLLVLAYEYAGKFFAIIVPLQNQSWLNWV
jgi:hypothetical protein